MAHLKDLKRLKFKFTWRRSLAPNPRLVISAYCDWLFADLGTVRNSCSPLLYGIIHDHGTSCRILKQLAHESFRSIGHFYFISGTSWKYRSMLLSDTFNPTKRTKSYKVCCLFTRGGLIKIDKDTTAHATSYTTNSGRSVRKFFHSRYVFFDTPAVLTLVVTKHVPFVCYSLI